jgi:hypothetical protein
METIYKGGKSDKTHVAAAYQKMLEGLTDSQLRELGFSALEIHKAKEFHESYAHRDMFSCVVGRELGISRAAAQKMQQTYRQLAIICR